MFLKNWFHPEVYFIQTVWRTTWVITFEYIKTQHFYYYNFLSIQHRRCVIATRKTTKFPHKVLKNWFPQSAKLIFGLTFRLFFVYHIISSQIQSNNNLHQGHPRSFVDFYVCFADELLNPTKQHFQKSFFFSILANKTSSPWVSQNVKITRKLEKGKKGEFHGRKRQKK